MLGVPIVAVGIINMFGALSLIFLKTLLPKFWKIKGIRYPIFGIYFLGLIAIIPGILGYFYYLPLMKASMHLAVLCLLMLVSLTLSLPIAKLIYLILKKLFFESNQFLTNNEKEEKPISKNEVDASKRKLILGVTGSIPLIGIAGASYGFTAATLLTKVRKIDFTFDRLPVELNGIKLLQISDLHIAYFRLLDDLEKMMESVQDEKVDFVFVTGDFCDDLGSLVDAIDIIQRIKPPGGIFACMGNHEYFRDPEMFKREFEQAGIPVLVNKGMEIKYKDVPLFIGAIDDPISLRGDLVSFHQENIESMLKFRNSEMFTIMMSHRPQGFIPASKYQIDLTLAGHLHGGQFGMFDRSIFDWFFPNSYFWGHYIKDNSQLYTTSGAGHWFPFRVGCPAELPIITFKHQSSIEIA